MHVATQGSCAARHMCLVASGCAARNCDVFVDYSCQIQPQGLRRGPPHMGGFLHLVSKQTHKRPLLKQWALFTREPESPQNCHGSVDVLRRPTQCHRGFWNQIRTQRGGFSSRGPRPANKLLHTYPPPYIFFHLPSSTLICFHHFSTFLSVHLIRFFIIIFPIFLQSFSPFSSPHSFHQLPSKMSFPQSPHLIHFKKINFAKYIAKHICHQQNMRTV